jgi:putative redox protein
MVEMNVIYEGELHCNAKHGPSGNVISTDAPKDNQGRGEAFSPTDLVGAALGTCMLTLMGIYVVTPIRRIGKLTVKIKVPKPVPTEHRAGMEHAAHTCPVTQSLHPDVQKVVTFEYAG